MRDFQRAGRSPIRVAHAAVATSHPLATLAGIEILREGGNAADAAVAAAAVLAVVEPQSTGLGGDGFTFYAPPAGNVIAYNGSGRAPAAADADWYVERGHKQIPAKGPHSVTIPGVVDSWLALSADHGRKDIGRLLEPSIILAREGYRVSDRTAAEWALGLDVLRGDPETERIFLPWGRAPHPGELHVQPELAATLSRIAKCGRDGFYAGPVAEDMAAALQRGGGLHSLEDFESHAGEYVTPISGDYRGVTVWQTPPNSQAIIALTMLAILSGLNPSDPDPLGPERLHYQIEAARLAYRDRDPLIGDPSQVNVPVADMLSPAYVDALRAHIDVSTAMKSLPSPLLRKSDTVYLCAVDRDGGAASVINSTYGYFGSGVVGPASGVLLQNRGAAFQLAPRHPNRLAPGKRPLHTIMPGMATRAGRIFMPFGVTGGDYQPFGQAHLLSLILDCGMDPQTALEQPRLFAENGRVTAERGFPEATLASLRERGHDVVVSPEPIGGGQAIVVDHDQSCLIAGSDPRKDGCAMGY